MITRKYRLKQYLSALTIPLPLLLFTVGTCWALSYGPPGSYEQITGADDEYRFVMLVASDPVYTNEGKAYPVSGLYKNDDSTTPLWQVDWFDNSVRITQDGRYLARIGFSAYSRDEVAVSFYDRGKLIRSLNVSEFVMEYDEPSPDMAGYEWSLGVAFDDKRGLLRITTLHGELLHYSMSTGQRVDVPNHYEPPNNKRGNLLPTNVWDPMGKIRRSIVNR